MKQFKYLLTSMWHILIILFKKFKQLVKRNKCSVDVQPLESNNVRFILIKLKKSVWASFFLILQEFFVTLSDLFRFLYQLKFESISYKKEETNQLNFSSQHHRDWATFIWNNNNTYRSIMKCGDLCEQVVWHEIS